MQTEACTRAMQEIPASTHKLYMLSETMSARSSTSVWIPHAVLPSALNIAEHKQHLKERKPYALLPAMYAYSLLGIIRTAAVASAGSMATSQLA